MKANDSDYLPIITGLRGIAALMICIFHFTHFSSGDFILFDPHSLLVQWGKIGTEGVYLFFIISGFIIPWSLSKYNFSWKDTGRFLIKRSIRIEVPYFVSILLILVVGAVFAWYNHQNFEIHPYQLFSHLAYLVPFTGQDWYNPIYWTLCIEFQFYVFVALYFPFLMRQHNSNHTSLMLVLIGSCFIPDDRLLFQFLPYFIVGICCFLLQKEKLTVPVFLTYITLALGIILFRDGTLHGLTTMVACLSITFLNHQLGVFNFLGKISFSLYLTHGVFGGNFLYFSGPLIINFGGRLCLVCGAILISITCAWVMYRLIEQPALRWSKRFAIRNHDSR